ncbi:MAG: hypothetical protein HOK69_14205 [Gammaproteobacteria bacterium]|jgi:CheY-like chemotaxis protein|nr:hypothetical protein [Gammaproteobacteria bacterium]MBT6078926.1 hypothetical protein [Gammaproteobacteria bacterium]MBT6480236.1 hypothetical protein [Gammaproteobacteria bacterium]
MKPTIKNINNHVLAVDSDPAARALYQNVLQPIAGAGSYECPAADPANFDLTLVEQGRDALSAVEVLKNKGGQFAVALIDVHLSLGIDGLETARHIHEIDPDVCIIFATADPAFSTKEWSQKVEGDVLFYRKPIDADELYQVIYNSCRGWSQNHALAQFRSTLELQVELLDHQVEEKEQALEIMQKILQYRDQQLLELNESAPEQLANNAERNGSLPPPLLQLTTV